MEIQNGSRARGRLTKILRTVQMVDKDKTMTEEKSARKFKTTTLAKIVVELSYVGPGVGVSYP